MKDRVLPNPRPTLMPAIKRIREAREIIRKIQAVTSSREDWQRFAELNSAHALTGDLLAALIRADSFDEVRKPSSARTSEESYTR